MEDQMIVVLVTVPDMDAARAIGRRLVEHGLAACVNMLSPISSIFSWEGKVVEEQEVLLMVKSRQAIFQEKLLPAILEAHPYQLPEILSLPVLAGNPAYFKWIVDTTGGSG